MSITFALIVSAGSYSPHLAGQGVVLASGEHPKSFGQGSETSAGGPAAVPAVLSISGAMKSDGAELSPSLVRGVSPSM